MSPCDQNPAAPARAASSRWRGSPALAVLAWLISMPIGPHADATEVQASDATAFRDAWRAYEAESAALDLHPDCPPRLFEHQGRERRGAAVLFHGFGGCPQQFLDMAMAIAAQGYDVVLPRLPGHGFVNEPGQPEDLTALPTGGDQQTRYAELAVRINDIMHLSPGARVMVGFSLGGAMAVHASLVAPQLYDRMLLLGPLLSIRGGAFVEGLAWMLGRMPGIRNLRVKPVAVREECKRWSYRGRGGFCDYRLKHVTALIALERHNREFYAAAPFTMPLQIVAAGGETVVSNERILDFKHRHESVAEVELCFLDEQVPHEMLSPYENTDIEMYWLDSLIRRSVEFVVDAKAFPATPGYQDGEELDICRL